MQIQMPASRKAALRGGNARRTCFLPCRVSRSRDTPFPRGEWLTKNVLDLLTENRELTTENWCPNPPPQPADPEIFPRYAHTHPRNPPPDVPSRSNPAPLLASNPAS